MLHVSSANTKRLFTKIRRKAQAFTPGDKRQPGAAPGFGSCIIQHRTV